MKRFSVLALLPLVCSPAHAIIFANTAPIDNHSTTVHDRFANDPAFNASNIDFTGVGHYQLAGSSRRQWVTMISENVFISARHTGAAPGVVTTFYPSNDPSSTPVLRTITNVAAIGNTDLLVGRLDSSVDPSIAVYDFITQTVGTSGTAYGTSEIASENAYISGISPNSAAFGGMGSSTNQAVGRNIIDAFQEDVELNVVGQTFTDAFLTVQNSNPSLTVANEATAASNGDSGAPVFRQFVLGGVTQTELIGVNLGRGSLVTGQNVGFASYVGNYATEIQDYIDLNAVPEPSSALLIGLATLGGLTRRRRCH